MARNAKLYGGCDIEELAEVLADRKSPEELHEQAERLEQKRRRMKRRLKATRLALKIQARRSVNAMLPTAPATRRLARQSAAAAAVEDPPGPVMAGPDWLTVTQAAELLRRDLPALTLQKARSRVSAAVSRIDFKSIGSRRDRRIEPHTFSTWRLKQRDRDLDAEDADEGL
jgi:hypothetical protein